MTTTKEHTMPKLTEAQRAYIYRVAVAVLAVAAAYGVIADEKVPVVVALIAALFPVGLAAKHTSTNP